MKVLIMFFRTLSLVSPRGGGGGVLLGILGGGVQPCSPNPDPISDQKCHFPHPFSDQTFFQTERKQKNS